MELFGTLDAPTDAARKILASSSGVAKHTASSLLGDDDGDQQPAKRAKTRLTDEERARYQKMVREAKSLREIERLERMLAEGKVPMG